MMASEPAVLTFEIGKPWIDPPGTAISDLPKAFTHIEADVRLHIGDRLFFDEAICIVELANAIHRWLSSGISDLPRFQFDSLDEEEPGILCFDIDADGAVVSSVSQKFEATEQLSANQVALQMRQLVHEVARRCNSELGLDVESWISIAGSSPKPDR